MIFDSLKNKFQLRFKNREFAAIILDGALEDSLKKIKVDKKKENLIVMGIHRGGVIFADIAHPSNPSYEIDITYLILSLSLVVLGAGALSLDSFIGLP